MAHKEEICLMKNTDSVSQMVFWLITLIGLSLFVSACAGIEESTDASLDAINKVRAVMELPDKPLEFVKEAEMINSPSGQLHVAVYQDSEGREYSVYPETSQVVEIDARGLLPKRSTNTVSMLPDELKKKASGYVEAVIPDFDALQSSLTYESGEKGDNYFFTWYGEMQLGDLNRPFLQIGLHKSGILFAYYNTLLLSD